MGSRASSRIPRRLPSLPRSLRPLLLVALAILIITQIVALTPSSLEETQSGPLDPQTLIDSPPGEKTLATAVPQGQIPEYTVEAFTFASTQNGQKQWKINAKKAFLFNKQRLVHSRQVTAYLYDSSDRITTVTGDEAQYFMNQRDLEIFGNVVTVLPDGFVIRSDYMRYLPADRRVLIPEKYPVAGQGHQPGSQEIQFQSYGMDFPMNTAMIELPRAVRFKMIRRSTQSGTSGETTEIDSDHCRIDRNQQIAFFTMAPLRPPADRFVRVRQPNMSGRGRTTDINYSSPDGQSSQGLLQYMTLREDVFIREKATTSDSLRYGTGGRADFDAQKSLITLREFPQVYQDNDTVTGDIIVVHRDTDVVEVDNSNAFSEGGSSGDSKKPSATQGR